MHCLAVKFRPVLCGMLAACRKTPMVALAIIEVVIDVSVEAIRAVEPRPGTDENTA
jgi:hypothetical protein